MASGRRSVNGTPGSTNPPSVPMARDKTKEDPAPTARGGANTTSHRGEEYGKVRVWWEPTDNKTRSGFGGAWWPAKVLSINEKKSTMRVKYDNGEEDDVHHDHVSPLDTLPVAFGAEQSELQPGEFCEVHNGSKTDPGAWLGRVVRMEKSKGYTVEYPFHDSKPEIIKAQRVRRARIMEDGEWRLIRPHQEWEDGEVTSPKELELIHEDDLDEFIEGAVGSNGQKNATAKAKATSSKRAAEEDKRPRGRPRKDSSAPGSIGSGGVGTIASATIPTGMTKVLLTMEPSMQPGGGFCFVPLERGSSKNTISALFHVQDMLKYESEKKKEIQRGVVDPSDVDDVLSRGMDLNKVKTFLKDLGYSKDAFLQLQDAWRSDSPRVADAMRAYKTHVHARLNVDWEAFLVALLGQDKVKTLKPKAK